jgi:hypothetical protein
MPSGFVDSGRNHAFFDCASEMRFAALQAAARPQHFPSSKVSVSGPWRSFLRRHAIFGRVVHSNQKIELKGARSLSDLDSTEPRQTVSI